MGFGQSYSYNTERHIIKKKHQRKHLGNTFFDQFLFKMAITDKIYNIVIRLFNLWTDNKLARELRLSLHSVFIVFFFGFFFRLSVNYAHLKYNSCLYNVRGHQITKRAQQCQLPNSIIVSIQHTFFVLFSAVHRLQFMIPISKCQ